MIPGLWKIPDPREPVQEQDADREARRAADLHHAPDSQVIGVERHEEKRSHCARGPARGARASGVHEQAGRDRGRRSSSPSTSSCSRGSWTCPCPRRCRSTRSTLASHLKDPTATDPQGFADVTIDSYTVAYRRTDGGTIVPPVQTFGGGIVVPSGGTATLIELPGPVRRDALRVRPSTSCCRSTAAIDRETGQVRDRHGVRHHVLRPHGLGSTRPERDRQRNPDLSVWRLDGGRPHQKVDGGPHAPDCHRESPHSRWSAQLVGCAADAPTAPRPGGGGTNDGSLQIALYTNDANPAAGGCSLVQAVVTLNGASVPDGTGVTFSTDLGTFAQNGQRFGRCRDDGRPGHDGSLLGALGRRHGRARAPRSEARRALPRLPISFQPSNSAAFVSSCSPSFGSPTRRHQPDDQRRPLLRERVLDDKSSFTAAGVAREGLVTGVTSTQISVVTPAFPEAASLAVPVQMVITLGFGTGPRRRRSPLRTASSSARRRPERPR